MGIVVSMEQIGYERENCYAKRELLQEYTHSSPLGLRATLKPRAGSLNFVRDPAFLPLFLGASIGGASTIVVICAALPAVAVPEPSFVWDTLLLATRRVCRMEPPALSEPSFLSAGR